MKPPVNARKCKMNGAMSAGITPHAAIKYRFEQSKENHDIYAFAAFAAPPLPFALRLLRSRFFKPVMPALQTSA